VSNIVKFDPWHSTPGIRPLVVQSSDAFTIFNPWSFDPRTFDPRSDRRIYKIIYIRLVFFCIFKCDQIDRKGREEEREKRKDAAVKGRSIKFLINFINFCVSLVTQFCIYESYIRRSLDPRTLVPYFMEKLCLEED
jgi:hypothetical protein